MFLPGQLLEALLAEGAGEELLTRVHALLREYDPAGARALGVWFRETFPAVFGSRTPTGMKDLKADAEWLHRFLDVADAPWSNKGSGEFNESQRKELEARWNRMKDRVPELVRFFSNEDKAEGKAVPAELKLGGVTYINGIGFDEKKLKKWATELNALWASVKGWRHKAVVAAGGLTVKLARPQEFRGTASGKYRSADDVLYVRATPNILKRAGGTYGAPDYILVHELGHRYEYKVKGLPTDFDKPGWLTTKYSRSEGEGFAELFALGHFGPGIQRVSTAVDDIPARLERFEKVMAGVHESEIGHLHLLPKDRKLAKARVKHGDRRGVIARGAGLSRSIKVVDEQHVFIQPDAYRRQHGKCPPGYHYDDSTKRCVKSGTEYHAIPAAGAKASDNAHASASASSSASTSAGSKAGDLAKKAWHVLAEPVHKAIELATKPEARKKFKAFISGAVKKEVSETKELFGTIGKAIDGKKLTPLEKRRAVNQVFDLAKVVMISALVGHLFGGGIAHALATIASPADEVLGAVLDKPLRRATEKMFGSAHGLLPSAFYEEMQDPHEILVVLVQRIITEVGKSLGSQTESHGLLSRQLGQALV